MEMSNLYYLEGVVMNLVRAKRGWLMVSSLIDQILCQASVDDCLGPILNYTMLHQDQESERLFVKARLSVDESEQVKVNGQSPQQKEQIHEVIHKVVYGDTLQGLSLQYDVSISSIRRRNNIDGDNIYHLKSIVIPNPQAKPDSKERTQELMIEEFVAHLSYSEKDKRVAKYYLVENQWKMEQALKQYREDLEWERNNKDKIQQAPIRGGSIEMQEVKRYYQRESLKEKKNK